MECSVSVEGAVRTPTGSSRISSTLCCGKERGFLAHPGYTRELYSGTASVRSLAKTSCAEIVLGLQQHPCPF